ncbi:MAG TPA: DUF3617 domain-containing protein [Nitrospiraceae bacterium]|nr:DUF3617 domain-containing protein [Nitrospiraceae bacterium]
MTRMAWVLSSSVILTVVGLTPDLIITGMATPALADSFNAKPGAWEINLTTLTTGMLIPPEVLAKMPPDQRAKIEQSMQTRSGKPMTHASKECVTQDDLDQNRMIKEENEEDGPQCTTKVISKSSSKLVIERTCPAPRASTSHMTMEAKTPESIVGSIDMTRAGSGKVHVDIKGRWLSASCAEIKDRD